MLAFLNFKIKKDKYKFDERRVVKQNWNEAFYWWGKATLKGHACAQRKIDFYYHNGYGKCEDYSKAFELFWEAGKLGKENEKTVVIIMEKEQVLIMISSKKCMN